jgi:hypothetical protein
MPFCDLHDQNANGRVFELMRLQLLTAGICAGALFASPVLSQTGKLSKADKQFLNMAAAGAKRG